MLCLVWATDSTSISIRLQRWLMRSWLSRVYTFELIPLFYFKAKDDKDNQCFIRKSLLCQLNPFFLLYAISFVFFLHLSFVMFLYIVRILLKVEFPLQLNCFFV